MSVTGITGSPLLELRGITKAYPSSPGGGDGVVLRGVDLTLDAGESLAVIGPSGCGKSTLLNIIATLEPQTSGQVLWRGDDLGARDERELAEFRNRSVGMVFQHHHLLPQCSALENVLVPTLPRGKDQRGAFETRARDLLERVGLGQRQHHRPAELSGGERQRVSVVRALINEPALLLADEPTGSLDGASATDLAQLLVELNERDSVALCVVTHSMALAERMQRCAQLEAGALVSTTSSATGRG